VKGLIVIGFALATFAISAAAAGTPATTLVGTAEWSGGTLENPATTTVIHGTFDGPLGKGTYEGTILGADSPTSANCDPVCQPASGSITFSGHRGSFTAVVQPGSVVGLVEIPSHSFRNFDLTLRVTDGTRGYAHADGLLSLLYTSTWAHFFDSNGNFINTITDQGTLTGQLH
jgi:hypothetical protein